RVGVAPAGGVALGRDQHVLAQGGEEAVAERAAGGGRLGVLGGGEGPPGGRLELGHLNTSMTSEKGRGSRGGLRPLPPPPRPLGPAPTARRLIRPRCQPPRVRRRGSLRSS